MQTPPLAKPSTPKKVEGALHTSTTACECQARPSGEPDVYEAPMDSLGVVPKPMTGGPNMFLQHNTNAARVRATIRTNYGLDVNHMTLNSELYNMPFSIECKARLNEMKALENDKNIDHFEKLVKQQKQLVVYMSAEDKASKTDKDARGNGDGAGGCGGRARGRDEDLEERLDAEASV